MICQRAATEHGTAHQVEAAYAAGVPMSWMAILYSHAPFFVRQAEGAYITDIDGIFVPNRHSIAADGCEEVTETRSDERPAGKPRGLMAVSVLLAPRHSCGTYARAGNSARVSAMRQYLVRAFDVVR